jgi:hypothetical protein
MIINNGGYFGDEYKWNRDSGISVDRIYGKENGKKCGIRGCGIHGNGGRKGGAGKSR